MKAVRPAIASNEVGRIVQFVRNGDGRKEGKGMVDGFISGRLTIITIIEFLLLRVQTWFFCIKQKL